VEVEIRRIKGPDQPWQKKKNVSKILSQRKRWALAVSIGLPSNGGKCKIGGPWYRAAGAKKRDPVSKVTRAK
jgi:hypothetical protein